jgi:hypothetical protein
MMPSSCVDIGSGKGKGSTTAPSHECMSHETSEFKMSTNNNNSNRHWSFLRAALASMAVEERALKGEKVLEATA